MGSARGVAIVEYAGVLAMMFVFGAAGAKALGVKVSGGAEDTKASIEAALTAPTEDARGDAPVVDASSSTEKAPVVPSSTGARAKARAPRRPPLGR